MPESNKEQGEEPDQFINFKVPAVKLSKLFNTKEFELIIPDYQRDYAWPEDFVLTLLDDIKKSLIEGKRYRIGALTLLSEKEEAPEAGAEGNVSSTSEKNKPPTKLEIIDGQQRLVTLAILALNVFDREEKNTIPFSNQRFYAASQRKIYENNKLIKAYLDDNSELKEILKNEFRAGKYLEFSVWKVHDISEAFRYFDSLNSRGKPLSGVDILKAYHHGIIEKEERLRSESQNNPVDYDALLRSWEKYHDDYEAGNRSQREDRIDKIQKLFDDYLFPILNWQKGERSESLNLHNAEKFYGISHPESDHKLSCFEREDQGKSIFLLGRPFVSGSNFFEFINYYLELMEIVENKTAEYLHAPSFSNSSDRRRIFGLRALPDDEQTKEFDMNREFDVDQKSWYTNLLFKEAVFCFADRFRPVDKAGRTPAHWEKEFFAKHADTIRGLALWSYFPRCYYKTLGWKSIDNYAIGQFDDKGFEAFNRPMFRQIKENFDPEVIRRKLWEIKKIDDKYVEESLKNGPDVGFTVMKYKSLRYMSKR